MWHDILLLFSNSTRFLRFCRITLDDERFRLRYVAFVNNNKNVVLDWIICVYLKSNLLHHIPYSVLLDADLRGTQTTRKFPSHCPRSEFSCCMLINNQQRAISHAKDLHPLLCRKRISQAARTWSIQRIISILCNGKNIFLLQYVKNGLGDRSVLLN